MKNLIFGSLFMVASTQAIADTKSITQCIDEKYQGLTNRKSIALAVVDRDNTQIFLYGQAKKDQIFEIGSVTKTFTATLLAEEVAAKNINLSDLIPSEYQKPGAAMTYQHLTTHTSGIIGGNFPGYESPNPESPYQGLTIPVFKELYQNTPLANPVSTHWEYSNIGTGLLGLILSEKNNSSYSDLVINNIFKPLGMNDSYFEVPADQLSRFPQGNVNGEPWSHWDLYATAIGPAGAIRSTISDMALYARANLIPDSTKLQSAIEIAHQPLFEMGGGTWIGMNWIVEPAKNLVWHNGSTIGFNSILAISGKHNVAVVGLTDTGIFNVGSDGEAVMDSSLEDIVFNCLK